jgi:small subunit ribosomal protein S9
MEFVNAIGRRKSSVARVYLTKGSGKITVNGKDIAEYFTLKNIQHNLLEPLQIAEVDKEYDVKVNVDGGGFKGQSEAARMAIARALVKINEEYRKPLKVRKLLTRDARVVERKKYGKPKARKSFQFSKR